MSTGVRRDFFFLHMYIYSV